MAALSSSQVRASRWDRRPACPGSQNSRSRLPRGCSHLKERTFDVFLGRVAAQGVDVQTLARQNLNVSGSTHRRLHTLIVDLFRSEDDVRIVTTNFDPHFTTALRSRYATVDIFNAPALPLGRDFSGLVYAHGSLSRREPLVLTDAGFGRAYLIDGTRPAFSGRCSRSTSCSSSGTATATS